MYFDVNCYLGSWPFSLFSAQAPAVLARRLTKAGIRRAALSPLDAVFQPEPMPANRRLFAVVRRETTFVPLPVVNPLLANWREQLAACAGVPGVRAVRLYPNYHHYRLTHRALAPFCAELEARGLRLVLTARLEDERHRYFALNIRGVPVADLAGFLGKFPRVTPLVTGLSVGEALKLAADHANFSADLSYQENIALAPMLRGKLPASRLMFGTLAPLVSVEAQVGKLTAPDFSAAERRALGFANAARFFS